MLTGVYMSMLGDLPVMEDFTRAGMVLTVALLMVFVSSWMLLRHIPACSQRLRGTSQYREPAGNNNS
jgi:hypothetical protein